MHRLDHIAGIFKSVFALNVALFIFIPLFIATSNGCSSFARIESIQHKNQDLEYHRGYGYLSAKGKNSVVSVVPTARHYKVNLRLSFLVLVTNTGSQPFLFSEDNISAEINEFQALVLSSDQLLLEAKKQSESAQMAAVLLGISAQMNASNAGYTKHTETSNISMYGPGGTAQGQVKTSGTSFDQSKAYAAQQQAQQQTADLLDNIHANERQAVRTIESSFIQKTTLRPGQSTSGVVVIELPKFRDPVNDIYVVVNVAGDEYRLHFKEIRVD